MKPPDIQQKGVVLLLLLLVLLVAGTFMMLGTFNNRQDLYVQQQVELSEQMRMAKEALLAFAANSSAIYANTRGPGFFPCPDMKNTGMPENDCDSSAVNLGRLPERIEVPGNKLFLNSYYAGTNQQFWYAVAPHYIYSATEADDRKALNRTSSASSRLVLDDTDNIIALIIAPGEALGFQDRNADPLAASNFLEGGNEDTDANFSMTAAAGPEHFNDRMIAITHDELVAYIATNVALKIKRLLDDDYYLQTEPKRYPGTPGAPAEDYQHEFAALLTDPSWLKDDDTSSNYEQWASNIIYTVASETQASIHFRGCSNMSFNLEYGAKMTRDHDSC